VATDGAFWAAAIGGDLAPKLAGGHETHGAPPGFHALALPLLAFPATLLLPAAAVVAWRRRREPGVRFALAWLVPAWILFEATPTKLPHYVLPLYAPLAWLCAAGLAEAATPWVRRIGAGLQLLAGGLLAAVALGLALIYGDALVEQVERGRWVLGDIVVHLGAPLGVDGGGNQRGPLGRGELGDFT
jgi:4-amino-4-deoxy-L-arabinose transferase-like glycosyltransferase